MKWSSVRGVLAAGLACVFLAGCGGRYATHQRVDVAEMMDVETTALAGSGPVRLGAGDAYGTVLYTYHLARQRGEESPARVIVFHHGEPGSLDPTE